MGKLIFGPVHSRRLGVSLGVDIVPKKICNLDCVYCEVGPTTTKEAQRDYYISWEDLESQFLEALQKSPEVITITGMGEPTLNRHLKTIVHQIKSHTSLPLVLLTNALLFSSPEVRQEVLDFSIICPSLDAVLEADFQKIDRPTVPIHPQTIIQGLIELRQEFKGQIWLEVLLTEGYNDSPEAIDALKQAALQIKPDKIHLNTVNRPPLTAMKEKFDFEVKPLAHEKLEKICSELGDRAEIIVSKNKKVTRQQQVPNLPEQILEYLKRRPADKLEIAQGLQVSLRQVGQVLEHLHEEQKVHKKTHEQRQVYYL